MNSVEKGNNATKTALITGITGQDGSYLAEFLLNKGYTVVGLARRTTQYSHENIEHLVGRVILEYGDLVDPYTLGPIITEYMPDEVYNLAAQSVPADSWKQPIVTGEITALGTVRLLEALRENKPDARFYQATSREIFSGIQQEVMNEDTPFLPNNPYGAAKLYAHLLTKIYRESHDMFTCGGIAFNHESPRRSLHFVTRKVSMAVACLKLGVENPPLNEHGQPLVENRKLRLGNLDARRDWGFAKEYVVAMWLMLQLDSPTDFVIATNTIHSIRDLCEEAFSHVGLNWKEHVISDSTFLRPADLPASRGDYSKAKSELNWEPKTLFRDMVRLMVDADIARLQRNSL